MLGLLSDYLPQKIYSKIALLDLKTADAIEEIRMRVNQPVLLTVNSEKLYLGTPNPIYASEEDILLSINALAEQSLYSKAESIINGYFSVKGGIRIGVCGNCVYENGILHTMNHFTSINIRIPHAVKGASKSLFKYINKNRKVENTLIISPPGQGKTTLLRDLVRAVSSGEKYVPQNCCIIDERSEIAGYCNGERMFDVGNFSDVLNNATKPDGIHIAVRTMSPEVIATDEIGTAADILALCDARNSGVSIIATAHAGSPEQLTSRPVFQKMLEEKIFQKFVLLGNSRGRGTIEGIFDETLNNIYFNDLRSENEDSALRNHIHLYISDRSESL